MSFSQKAKATFDFDTSKLNVAVTLDRQTYLPGEVARVTLEISNRTASSIKTLMPLGSETGCLYLRWKEDGRLAGSPHTDCVSMPVRHSNTVVFKPGETKRLVLNSYDHVFDIGQMVMEGGGAVTLPGEYGITYWYGTSRSTAEYSVAPAQLEADSVVRLNDIMFSDHPQTVPPQPCPMYVHVMALRSEGISYICVQQHPVHQSGFVAGEEGLRNSPSFDHKHVSASRATPLKRVAESASRVVSLSATADREENLTIQFTDSAGRHEVLHYGASYPAFKSW